MECNLRNLRDAIISTVWIYIQGGPKNVVQSEGESIVLNEMSLKNEINSIRPMLRFRARALDCISTNDSLFWKNYISISLCQGNTNNLIFYAWRYVLRTQKYV